MNVSKTRVNEILYAASADDPAARLQNLERDIDLVKISIKRILIDIRERMNELENPLVIVSHPRPAPARNAAAPGPADRETSHRIPDAPEPRPDTRQVTPEPRGETIPAAPFRDILPDPCRSSRAEAGPSTPAHDRPAAPPCPLPEESVNALPLPAAFNLFRWTQNGVQKYGHTRFELLIETYRVMGYIGQKTSREVHQISLIMPLCNGEEGEVGPGEFVSEIYHLKRILTPGDTSLDRDMVDALLAWRQNVPQANDHSVPEILTVPDAYGLGKRDREWMNLRA